MKMKESWAIYFGVGVIAVIMFLVGRYMWPGSESFSRFLFIGVIEGFVITGLARLFWPVWFSHKVYSVFIDYVLLAIPVGLLSTCIGEISVNGLIGLILSIFIILFSGIISLICTYFFAVVFKINLQKNKKKN